MWVLMSNMSVVMCSRAGEGLSVYDLLLSMLCASGFVVSINVVRICCPYAWLRDVFRVSCMFVASS